MKEVELPFNTETFRESWEEWLTYRKERKLPKYVPTGLKRTFTALVRDGGGTEAGAVAIIINAIEKNWQGLFPIKENGINQNAITNGTKPTTSEARINALGNLR